jgi:hypothetical protein
MIKSRSMRGFRMTAGGHGDDLKIFCEVGIVLFVFADVAIQQRRPFAIDLVINAGIAGLYIFAAFGLSP